MKDLQIPLMHVLPEIIRVSTFKENSPTAPPFYFGLILSFSNGLGLALQITEDQYNLIHETATMDAARITSTAATARRLSKSFERIH